MGFSPATCGNLLYIQVPDLANREPVIYTGSRFPKSGTCIYNRFPQRASARAGGNLYKTIRRRRLNYSVHHSTPLRTLRVSIPCNLSEPRCIPCIAKSKSVFTPFSYYPRLGTFTVLKRGQKYMGAKHSLTFTYRWTES